MTIYAIFLYQGCLDLVGAPLPFLNVANLYSREDVQAHPTGSRKKYTRYCQTVGRCYSDGNIGRIIRTNTNIIFEPCVFFASTDVAMFFVVALFIDTTCIIS